MDELRISPLAAAALIATAVLGYYGLLYIEAWTIENLCREVVRCN